MDRLHGSIICTWLRTLIMAVTFFIGLDHPSQAKYFGRCMISVNSIRDRKSYFPVGRWIMDSGAFTEISNYGEYRHHPEEYAKQIRRWSLCGKMLSAVTQDYMCEPFILEKTGLDIAVHQRLTISRYDAIVHLVRGASYIMPVLQGFSGDEYVKHLKDYGSRITHGAWVGVGSVCKRNSKPAEVLSILKAIKCVRPDLMLHGFGLKKTSLRDKLICSVLYSSDSMAWSFSARKHGKNSHSLTHAKKWLEETAHHAF